MRPNAKIYNVFYIPTLSCLTKKSLYNVGN